MDEISVSVINGKSFVSGLMWQPLQKQRAYMKEARAIGKAFDMDIVSIRESDHIIQAGFVKRSEGANKGMYSMASAMAGCMPDTSWIGAFRLPNDLYALVAVSGGAIIPGCDVVGSLQEIRNLLVEKDSQRAVLFEKVFHPKEFDYRGEELDISEILRPERLKNTYKLRRLTLNMSKRELVASGLFLAAAIAAGIGYMQWNAYQLEAARLESIRLEKIRQQQLAELAAKSATDLSEKALRHPWAEAPGAADFLNACQSGIDSIPLSIGGWLFDSAICTDKTLEMVFSRTPSTTFSEFYDASLNSYPSPPVLLDGGERAGVGVEIKIGAGGDDILLTVEEARRMFTSRMQMLEIKPTITEVAVKPPAPEALPGSESQQPPPPPAPDWLHFNFEVSSDHPPQQVFGGFDMPGLRLRETVVTRSSTDLKWTIKGDIYAR